MSVEIEKILGDLSGYLAGRDININIDAARIEALEEEITKLKEAQQILPDNAQIDKTISDKEAELLNDYFAKAVQALLGDELDDARHYFELVRTINPDDAQAAELLRAVETKLKERGKTQPPAPTPWHMAYLNRVLATSSHLSLTGIDPKAASSQTEARLNLSAVYTALLTLSPEHHDRLLAGEKLGREAPRLSALTQLDRHKHLVLLGDPGSGKTTFVNFVAMCLVGESLAHADVNLARLTAPLPNEKDEDKAEAEPQPWRHGPLLPVRLILRDFAARGLPPVGQVATAQHLYQFVAAELERAALGDYAKPLFETLLRQGGLLFLDGLDEVPDADQRRSQIKQAVEDFARTFGQCRILVTSRTYAYQKQDWQLTGFVETVLAPFSQGQIRWFVERWYEHMAGVRGLDAEDAQGRAALLKQAIFHSDRLRGLAERPLLLTLMASLHAWRGGSLPEKREELYNDTVELLLDWWESPKVVKDAQGQTRIEQPSLAEWLRVDRDKVRGLLNQLAYEAHTSQPELTGTADIAEEALVGGLLRLSQNPDARPGRLVEYLSERAGLLLPRGVGVYTFPHRTFQEYLAACHLTDADYPDLVAELARNDPNRWREVALLAGAKSARGTAAAIWGLADALCYEPVEDDAATDEDMWGALLAAQSLVETANLTEIPARHQSKVVLIRDWLKQILATGDLPAVERVLAGVLLARLGDDRPGVGLGATGLPDIVWCDVEAGPFLMGSDRQQDRNARDDEQPQHQVMLPDYEISRYPITNAQYQAFVGNGGYQNEAYWPEAKRAGFWQDGQVKRRVYHEGAFQNEWATGPYDYGPPFNLTNHPVVGVNGYEAVAFCYWLSESLGQLVCLPTEAEWEKAARGTDGRLYPWGDQANPERMNYSDTGIGTTSAVGSFVAGASPYGCQDMAGNVWEWCATRWRKDYPYDVTEVEWDEKYLSGTGDRVLRGGAFLNDDNFVRAAVRYRGNPDVRVDLIGFRVVRAPMGSES